VVRERERVGVLVRDWRRRRRLSQLDLSLEVGVSTRHLSFVETGRSRPSPELVLALAERLDIPLRDRNELLLAAGYAPRYAETPLDAAAMTTVRSSLARLLRAHDPYPGLVIDRAWNVVLANPAADRLLAGLPAHVLGPPVNVFRVSLHPDGLARRTVNFPDWARYLLDMLHRATASTTVLSHGADTESSASLTALAAEIAAYPNLAGIGRPRDAGGPPELVVPLRLRADDATDAVELSLFTTLTRFSTPTDITLAELAVELFFPTDDTTDELLRAESRD
jgi:transcriptional regulator with XRE-family HTH domain